MGSSLYCPYSNIDTTELVYPISLDQTKFNLSVDQQVYNIFLRLMHLSSPNQNSEF